MSDTLYIGWDVGAWHCPEAADASKSQDALAIIRNEKLVGTWSGNLRRSFEKVNSALDLIVLVSGLCGVGMPDESDAILAIDAPLAFPQSFLKLLSSGEERFCIDPKALPRNRKENDYLYRSTEKVLFNRGFRPLSPVQDMIGSQATKAIHLLNACSLKLIQQGVWSDRKRLRVIEAYPTTCEFSNSVNTITAQALVGQEIPKSRDIRDALTCAAVAALFDRHLDQLITPNPAEYPIEEGWIWAPKDYNRADLIVHVDTT